MKRIAPGIIIIAILMLVGCNNAVIDNQVDTTTGAAQKVENAETVTTNQTDQSISPTSSLTSIPSSNSSNYVETYEDETHKEIQYGKLLINLGFHHIVSDKLSDNSKTFMCEIDKGKVRPETHMTIKIRAIEKQDFLDTRSIVASLSDMSPNYEKIRIYNDVNDSSGIISLYTVTGDGLTNYVVCYRDVCYLVESDYSILDIYLFKNDLEANYEMDKLKIDCANSITAYVNETISYNDNEFEKAEYEIIQGKDGKRYSAELNGDGGYEYSFILKNENSDNLLTLSTYADFYDAVKFLDANMDGYVDIQFCVEMGTLNNSYALYVWDDFANNYVKVKCDEMLSNFEVHDGYLLKWGKNDAQSGVIDKLVWDKNTLIKVSEEQYHADEMISDTPILTQQELLELMDLQREAIISKLGGQFSVVSTGAEGSYEGYYYDSLGITITFEYDNSVAFIGCNEKVVIDGAYGGMTFSQIKEKLGEAEIVETFFETPENKAYKIEYVIKNCIIKFFSYSIDGSESELTIYKSKN